MILEVWDRTRLVLSYRSYTALMATSYFHMPVGSSPGTRVFRDRLAFRRSQRLKQRPLIPSTSSEKSILWVWTLPRVTSSSSTISRSSMPGMGTQTPQIKCMFHYQRYNPHLNISVHRRHLLRLWLRNEELAWKLPDKLQKFWDERFAIEPKDQTFALEPVLDGYT